MKYSKSFTISLLLSAAFTIVIASCGSKTESKPEAAVEEVHTEGELTITLSQQQFNSINVQLGRIEQKNLTGTFRASGFLKVPPQNKANVTSPLGGTVKSILVQEGDLVSKGQTLATLSSPEFIKIQQEYLVTHSHLTFATAEFKRQKELSEKNISAQKTFQQTESDYNSLIAKQYSLKEQLLLLNINAETLTAENIASAISIKSPINGNISHIDINIGKTVQSSDEIMDVVDNSQLHLDLFIYEQDLSKIKIGQNVDVMLTNLPGKHYTAKIFSIGSAFEGESKSIPVHANVTGNKAGLIEGMNVTANIAIENNTVPAVPEASITTFGGNDYIFVEAERHEAVAHKQAEGEAHEEGEQHKVEHDKPSDGLSFQRIQIKRGISDNGFVEITPLQEMHVNVKVVVNGGFYLMSMMTNDGEHEH